LHTGSAIVIFNLDDGPQTDRDRLFVGDELENDSNRDQLFGQSAAATDFVANGTDDHAVYSFTPISDVPRGFINVIYSDPDLVSTSGYEADMD
jgi:hypothetical protein